MYLPEEITLEIFDLGCRYQSGLVSKDQAIEVAESIAKKITETLDLDTMIVPLSFLSEEQTPEEERT